MYLMKKTKVQEWVKLASPMTNIQTYIDLAGFWIPVGYRISGYFFKEFY